MTTSISAKQLRASLSEVVRRAREGVRFTVIYRGQPAFQIVPVSESEDALPPLEEDPLYEAESVGRSTEAARDADHDDELYGR
jgi:prevent-host-death family protein